jgi:membrane-associated phospholipid phosphatase
MQNIQKSFENDETTDSQKAYSGLIGVLRELGWYIAGGLVVALGLLWLFFLLSRAIFSNTFSALDNGLLMNLHQYENPVLDAIFWFFTTVGGIAGILIMTALVFAFLIWRKHYHAPWILALAVGGGVLINQGLKFFYERPRPDLWASDYRPATFSFPSGHAMTSFCFFAMLIWLGNKYISRTWLRRVWAVAMVFCILMVGLSRLYFGVHYPTDVIGGYIAAAAWIIAVLGGVAIYDRLHPHKAQPEPII